jgi:predicted methyltransferase
MRAGLMGSMAVGALLAAACQTTGAAQVSATSPNIVAAVADAARPQDANFDAGCIGQANPCAGVKLDPFRKPAEMLAFGEVKPGMKIGELIPGGGYMTRLFSKAVGASGKVYLFNAAAANGRALGFQPVLDDKTNYPNVSFVETDFAKLASPEPLDLVWTSQNYHDMHNPGRNLDIAAANRSIFNALKPGGIYVVLDHVAAADTPGGVNAQFHRIVPAMVKQEVLAAGFEFVGESAVLRNPNDPHDKGVFDDSIRHRTDQFMMKFRRPG